MELVRFEDLPVLKERHEKYDSNWVGRYFSDRNEMLEAWRFIGL